MVLSAYASFERACHSQGADQHRAAPGARANDEPTRSEINSEITSEITSEIASEIQPVSVSTLPGAPAMPVGKAKLQKLQARQAAAAQAARVSAENEM